MPKVIIVREFDKITCNENYKDYPEYVYIEEKYFNKIKEFIKNEDAKNEDAKNDESILEFSSFNIRKNIGDTITFKNFVGVLNIDDSLQIEILPKIDFIVEAEDAKIDLIRSTKEIFLRMIKSLLNISNKTFSNAKIDIHKMPIFEIFISMYITEVREITKRGLKSAYFQVEDNKKVLKGKLLFNKHIKHNLVHKEKFYVEYDEYGLNRSENKILKSTLLKLQKITSSYQNAKQIKQELVHFDEVDESYNYDYDFSKITINRNNRLYEQALSWSKIFLTNNSFSSFSGKSNSTAILFPMEKVYEEYVAKELRKASIKKSWRLKTQDKQYSLFNSLNGNPINGFKLQPDIVLSKYDKLIILDTKWKRLSTNYNYGILQADMYQMYAYSKKYNTSEVWLLYPLTSDMKQYKDNIIRYSSDDNVNVSIYFVDLNDIGKDMEKLINLINLRESTESEM